MAKDPSFDIVSEVDLQAIDDAINVAMKDVNNRFDLKNTDSKIEFNRQNKKVIISAPSEFQLNQVKDILKQKMAKRGISPKSILAKNIEKASGDSVRETNDIVCGIPQDLAKNIIKDIKGLKIKKLTASIQEDKIRVTAKNRDDLQTVIAFLKEKQLSIPLQFTNYR